MDSSEKKLHSSGPVTIFNLKALDEGVDGQANEANREVDEDGLKDDEPTDISKFDLIVGELEDIIIDERFLELQSSILERHWHHFEDEEENKLIYTDIFTEYTSAMEEFIEKELSERLSDFSMEEFLQELNLKKVDLEGDVFDLLYTLSDFMAFKELFLDFAKDKSSVTPDLSSVLKVTPAK